MSTTLRILAVASLLASAAGARDTHAQSSVRTGSLDAGDPTLDSGESYDEYTIDVATGQEVVAVASAVDFDPYLILIAPSGEPFENDDHGGSSDVALVETVAAEGGTWRVRVTSFEAGETGQYALVHAVRARTDVETIDEEFTTTGTIEPGGSVTGRLADSDPKRADGSHYHAYAIDLAAGDAVTISLTSSDFDAYLTVVSPTGRALDDDDGGGDTHSRLELVADEAGRWTIVANTLEAGETGGYELSVQPR